MLRPPTDNPTIKLLNAAITEPMVRTVLNLPNAQIFKDDADRSVFKTTLSDNSPVIIKCRRFRGLKSFIRRTFGHSPLQNELRGLRTLAKLNIPTSAPLAYIRSKECEAIVLRYIPGPTLLEVLAGPPLTIAQESKICRAVAQPIFTLFDKKFCNRDNKPSNLIVLDLDTNPRIAIIDAAGIRRVHTFGDDGIDQMLASLFIEPKGTGIQIRRGLAMRLVHAFARAVMESHPIAGWFAREYWIMAKLYIDAHGDTTPRVNPLAAAKDIN